MDAASGLANATSFLDIFLILLIVLSPYWIAMCTKVDAKTAAPTERRVTLSSPLSPEAVFKKLAGASFGHCTLTDSDAARRVLVLFSPMREWSLGYYYPVFITPGASGSAIEVGIKPRIAQHPLTTSNNHKACVAEIEKALAA